ncbi:SDR family oxidoreductase [Pedobacter steynii]|uniref:Oxidoreductase n=1 Tax=Pedobacter steynii TaxID=430522 RepID=A0A1D7QJL7_9SPHI|nr:SDR family oxidoreductase [Pedobacter steynii]AOM78867.1 oxidoreductase [Pedobacter steynii]
MKNLNDYWTKRISGKKVLVTGGTTGIGREVVILLVALGARCMICGRNQPQIDETITAAIAQGGSGSCEGLVADLADADDIINLFETTDRQLGGIDILINNAALGYGSVTEGSYQDWDYIIRTNLTAYLACAHQAIKRMEAAGSGHIINIGSMSADVREVGSSVYVATKSAIQGFSETLRKEVNCKGIKVTLIEPGAVDTDMQPDSGPEKEEQVQNLEMLRTEDIAMAVTFCLAQHERCDVVNMQIRPHLQII